LVSLHFGINEMKKTILWIWECYKRKLQLLSRPLWRWKSFPVPLSSLFGYQTNIHCWAYEVPHTLYQLLENPSALVSRKVVVYAFYALKHREELLMWTQCIIYCVHLYFAFYVLLLRTLKCCCIAGPAQSIPLLCMGRWSSKQNLLVSVSLHICIHVLHRFISPWYNRNGWLSTKHKVTYLYRFL